MTSFAGNQQKNDDDQLKRSLLQRAHTIIWKRFADGHELNVSFFTPTGHSAAASAPSVLFYSGGMWCKNLIDQLAPWALQLADRGIPCLVPELRTHDAYEVTAEDIMEEGLQVWEWCYAQAEGLGLNPKRITVAGIDAGGLLALNAAMQPIVSRRRWWQFWRHDELPNSPVAVAIFRGVVDPEAPEARVLRVVQECTNPAAVNPCTLLRKRLPPLFCAHGMDDPLLDFETVEWFCKKWQHFGNSAEILSCSHADHTLANFSVNPALFEHIMLAWKEFMVSRSLWPEDAIGDITLN